MRPDWIRVAPRRDRFKGRKRKKPLDQVVFHESVTRGSAIGILKRRKLSINYEISPAGVIVEHCPPERRTAHAGGAHNARSVGVEHVSRYYGKAARDGEMVIPARWAHKGKYIVPPQVQCESSWRLTRWLCIAYDIPFAWPGLEHDDKDFRWGRIKDHDQPGIMAHHRWAHADALFFEYYCLLRYGGMERQDAYEAAIRSASSGLRVTSLPIGLYCTSWFDNDEDDWRLGQ